MRGGVDARTHSTKMYGNKKHSSRRKTAPGGDARHGGSANTGTGDGPQGAESQSQTTTRRNTLTAWTAPYENNKDNANMGTFGQ